MLDVWFGLFGLDYQKMRQSWVTWLTYWMLYPWVGVQKGQSYMTDCTQDDYPEWVRAL